METYQQSYMYSVDPYQVKPSSVLGSYFTCICPVHRCKSVSVLCVGSYSCCFVSTRTHVSLSDGMHATVIFVLKSDEWLPCC